MSSSIGELRSISTPSLQCNINPHQIHEDYIKKYDYYLVNDDTIKFIIFLEDPSGHRSTLVDSNSLCTFKSNLNFNTVLLQQQQSNLSMSSRLSNKQKQGQIRINNNCNKIKQIDKINSQMLMTMVFGSYPVIVSNQNAIKVHSMKSSNKIMISNVFNYYVQHKDKFVKNYNGSQQHSNDNSICNNNRISDTQNLNYMKSDKDDSEDRMHSIKNRLITSSNPVPITKEKYLNTNSYGSSVHSNNSNSPSSQSMPITKNQSGGGSYMYKRLMRSVSNSLVNNHSLTNKNLVDYCNQFNDYDTKYFFNESTKITFSKISYKIGLSVLFCLSESNTDFNETFYEFFFSHLPLIESHVKELRSKVVQLLPLWFQQRHNSINYRYNSLSSLKSLNNNLNGHCSFPYSGDNNISNLGDFKQSISKSFQEFRCKFDRLYNSPRITPAWLSIIINNSNKSLNVSNRMILDEKPIYNCLVNDFYHLHEYLKGNLFFNTIFSTIIRNNLSWVYTVIPNDDENICELSTYNLKLRKRQALWTNLDIQNPYNPLWAQLGDLYGAVGEPSKLIRTVIIGNNRNMVTKLLFVISYFIRSGKSCYYDIKKDETETDKIDQEQSKYYESLNDQREVNVFEISASPIINATVLNVIHNKPSSGEIKLKYFERHIESNEEESFKLIQSQFKKKATDYNLFNLSLLSSSSSSSTSSFYSKKSRHVSSNSTGNSCIAQELPLINFKLEHNSQKSTLFQNNFGYSLLAGYCEKFQFDFVLHGTSDRSFLSTLCESLAFSKMNSILDCQIEESMYIVIDTDEQVVKTYSSESPEPKVENCSNSVNSLIESTIKMYSLFENSEFILLHIEDKLQELYFQAQALYLLKLNQPKLDNGELRQLLNVDDNDLEFLKRIVNIISLSQN